MWTRYVALGDSFTEGLMDENRADGRHRGWADRLAQELADVAYQGGAPGIEYANLAIRGRLLASIVDSQVPEAVKLKPDLVSLAAGVNDCLRRQWDVGPLAATLDRGVASLRAHGSDVLLFSYGDPSRRSSVLGRIRARIIELNEATESIAERHGCMVVRYWDAAVMDDDRLWDQDRLHLSAVGHEIASRSALHALGLGPDSWRTPFDPQESRPWMRRTASDVAWITGHVLPWLGRRVRGSSSGDAITPKDATWRLVEGRPRPE